MIVIKNNKIFEYLLVAVLGFLTFGNSLFNQYNLDDEIVVVTKNNFSFFSDLANIFFSSYFEDSQGTSYEYRPVAKLSYYLDAFLFGGNVFISHIINFIIYIFSCFLIYKILVLYDTKFKLVALLSACVFIIHPIHTEVVCSIKNRDELLSMLFFLLAIYCLVLYSLKKHSKYILLYITLIIFSLLSKRSSIAVSLLSVFYVAHVVSLNTVLKYVSGLVMFVLILLVSQSEMKFIIISTTIYSLIFFALNFYKRISLSSFKAKVYEMLYHSKKTLPVTTLIICFILKIFFKFSDFHTIHFISAVCITALTFIKLNSRLNLFFFIITSNLLLIEYGQGNVIEAFSLITYFFILIRYKSIEEKNILHPVIIFILCVIIFYSNFLFQIKLGKLKILSYHLIYASIVCYLLFSKSEKKILKIVPVITALLFILIGIVSGLPNLLYSLFVALAFILLYFYRNELNFKVHFGLLALIVSLFFYSNSSYKQFGVDLSESLSLSTQINYLKANSNKKIIEKNEYRPLNFVEYPLSKSSTEYRLGNAANTLSFYFKKIVFPYPLGYYYGYSFFENTSIFKVENLFWAVCYLILITITVVLFFYKRFLFVSLCIFLSSLLLFSNLLYPIPGVVADRLAYFASLGYCLFIGFILSFAFKTDKKEIKISFLKFSILLIFFSANIAYSISRNKDWYNHLTLMRNDISYLDKSAQAHNLLANQLMSYSFKEEHKNESNEMRQEAIQHFKKALEIYPNFFNATYDLGRCYMIMNQSDSALILFEKTYLLDSTFSDALYNIAIIYDQKNDLELAKNYYKKTLKINKSNLDAYLGLSYAYYRMNRIDSAIVTNMEALKVNPNWKEPRNNLLYLNSL